MRDPFWFGKRVLVTGHTGFKGSWLSLWLQQLGAEVTGFALSPPTFPNLFDTADIGKNMNSIIGDVRDASAVRHVLQQEKSEIVIHMAAQSLVRKSYINPIDTYATNVMGTVNVLDAVRQSSYVKAVVNVTSDKCYENKETNKAFVETDPMGGHDPYSNSKGCAELVASAFANSYFNCDEDKSNRVSLASARAGNVIGGGDWAEDRLLPDIFNALNEHQAIVIRNPNAIRPWQHVLEPLSGYLLLAKTLYLKKTFAEGGWNFGPADDDAKSVQWIVNKICNEWGNGASWRLDEDRHPHEAKYLKLDSNKATTLLDWQPKWPVSESIIHTVSWYKAFYNSQNMRDFTIEQIKRFNKV